jgi:hypothetical protein
VVYFFKLEDNGAVSLAHLLLGGFEGCCTLASASAAVCRMVEAESTSSVQKKKLGLMLKNTQIWLLAHISPAVA